MAKPRRMNFRKSSKGGGGVICEDLLSVKGTNLAHLLEPIFGLLGYLTKHSPYIYIAHQEGTVEVRHFFRSIKSLDPCIR